MGEPRTISIKVTFTDDELYENFIEPRKINAELPTLVVRLLTTYARNEDLATQIDQFIDQTENPEIYEARNAIMDAIARISALDSMATQELERLDGEEGFVSDDEVDVVTNPSGEWEPDIRSTPDTGYSSYEGGVSDIQPLGSGFSIPSHTPEDTGTHTDSLVLNSLESLTKQVSSLTSAVSQMVEALAPRVGDLQLTPSRADFVDTVTTVTNEPSGSVSDTGISAVSTSIPVSELGTPIEEPVTSVADTSDTATQGDGVTPNSATPKTSSQGIASQDVIPMSDADTSTSDSESDEYDIPDFMFDMLKSIG